MCFQGMVCVQEEQEAHCIVRDMSTRTDGTCQSSYSVTLPGSTTVRQFVHQVASHFSYEPSNIELILTLASGTDISLKESSEETLQSCGIRAESRNNFILQTKKGSLFNKRRVLAKQNPLSNKELSLGASASPTTAGDYPTYHISAPAPPAANQEYPYTAGLIKQDTGYVGLVNQAMTCYLNSLLQALFMTPEFRNALYNWKYDNTTNSDPAKCIPYQLQRLFLNLQTSHRTAVETTELTKSFGWDSSEAWQQHDIQELCRVMFDALEQVFKGTDQADLIDRLYQGKMIDYVKCLECGKEKSREDTFLDIPLPVRPFGSTVAYGSVVEALRAFVQPETLEGANQYFCEACTKKCNAHKGLKFTKFPYLLTLHLKRFDFDYSTMHRIKLNDKVAFPNILDLNGFVEQQSQEKEEGSEGIPDNELTASKCDDSSTTDSGSALDDESCQGTTDLPASQDMNQEDDEGIDVSGSNHHENEKNRNHGLQKGPYLYELFSIMIHSGSASGGHYYAYIKDFASREWFCFNDTSVSRITNDDITKTYGGGALRGYYSGAYSSSTNAYMLMYRQINDENCSAIKVADFPPHIKDLYSEIEESRETDRRIKERHADTTKVKVYCHHPSSTRKIEARIYVENSSTLGEVTAQAYDILKLDGLVDLSNCRLVSYNSKQESIEMSFDGKEKELFTEIMASVKLDDLLLEIKNNDEEFEVYQPGGVTVKLYVVNVEKDEVEVPPTTIRSLLSSTVAELKESTSKMFNIDQNDTILVTQKYTNDFQVLEDDTMTLQNVGFYTSNKVYFSKGPLEKPFINSKLYKLLDRFEHVITLNISLPDTDPDTLARMSIPSLSSYIAAASAKNGGDSLATTPLEKDLAEGIKTCGSRGLMLPLILTGGAGGGDEESGGISSGGGGASGGHSDQSTSEDSSLTDSDRTLIGDVQEICWLQGENQLASPPEEEASNPLPASEEENWDEDPFFQPPPVLYNYFKATPYSKDLQRMLRVQVDKRMSVDDMKVCLEPYVGVPVTCFKLYNSSASGNTEHVVPRTRPCEMLTGLHNEDTLTIRLARQLTSDERKVKVYQLILSSPHPTKYLCDWIIAKGGTVAQTKKDIIDDINKRDGLNLQYNKCRLRKKNWKDVGRVYLDNQTWMDDITLYSNGDILLQELAEPDTVTSTSQVCLFVRHWRPSTLTLDPFQEVVLDSFSVDELKQKLSQMSNIPVEHIEIAKPSGSFPCEMSVLTIHTELEWNPKVSTLEMMPLQISEEGGVILYRDDREEQKVLSQVEKIDLGAKETARLCGSSGTHSTYSPRKEKPLKIYLERRPCYSAEADND